MSASPDPLILLNPAAGSFERNGGTDGVRKALQRAGLPTEWEEITPENGPAQILARRGGNSPVVAMGGDGTVQAVARALVGSERPLSIIPLGTGNVLALRLSIPVQLDAALRVVRDGLIRKVDVGILDDEPFLLGVGMGVDGRLIREVESNLKKSMGQLAYIWSAVRNLQLDHHQFRVEVDGEKYEFEAANVIVANFGTQVGPWVFPPEAHGGDGKLEVAILRVKNLPDILSILAAPFVGGSDVDRRGVTLLRGKDIRIQCERPIATQCDGEDMGDMQELRAGIWPEALSVLVSSKRPALQWDRQWPPEGFDWSPWERRD